MQPIYELPATLTDVDVVHVTYIDGEGQTHELHLEVRHDPTGRPYVEAPRRVGTAHGWTRRPGLEFDRDHAAAVDGAVTTAPLTPVSGAVHVGDGALTPVAPAKADKRSRR